MKWKKEWVWTQGSLVKFLVGSPSRTHAHKEITEEGGVVWKRPTRRRTNNELSWAYLCHGKMQLSFYTLSRELLVRPGGPVETSTAGDARALNSTNTGRRVIAAVYKLPEDRNVWRLVQVYFLYLLMCFCRWLSGVLGDSAVERLNTKEEKFSTTWLITLGV